MRELKMGPMFVKAVSAQDRTATGIYSVFGNRDSVGDVVYPGAFSKTLQERGGAILHLWMHDDSAPPIAKITGIREVAAGDLPAAVTAAAPNALGGLEVTRQYLTNPRAQEVWENLAADVPLQGSFAFDAIKADITQTATGQPMQVGGEALGGLDDWAVYRGLQDGSLTRNLREIRLWETSDVNWGANEATVAAKSRRDLAALYAELVQQLTALKSGARHSAADVKALNDIHRAVVALGATNCKGVSDAEDADSEEDAAKSRAAVQALTQYKADLTDLELYLLAR